MNPWALAAFLAGVAALRKFGIGTSSAPGTTTPGTSSAPPPGVTPPAGTSSAPPPGATTPAPGTSSAPPPTSAPPAPLPIPYDVVTGYLASLPPPANNTPPPPPSGVSSGAVLGVEQQLTAGGGQLTSSNGAFSFKLQGDGNAVLYDASGRPLWGSGTDGTPNPGEIKMQGDGNLVIYTTTGAAVWGSGTDGHPGAVLRLNDNGTLTIELGGAVLWSVGTPQANPAPAPGGGGSTAPAGGPVTLPPAPGRDVLGRIRCRFNGVPVTNSLGVNYPSWGPEIGMLTNVADRHAVYDAHLAAGANGIALATFIHYQESGVAYPNGVAASNDFTNNLAGLYALLVEIMTYAGGGRLWPVLFLGADELTPAGVTSRIGAWVQALRTGAQGDITDRMVFVGGFDSVDDGIWSGAWSAGDVDTMLVAIRQAIGGTAVQLKENAIGKAFWSGGATGRGGADCYTSPAGQSIDGIIQEFDAGGLIDPWPGFTSASWDAEHQDYAPNWVRDAGPWLTTEQIAARTVNNYQRPADVPMHVPATAQGGPNAGQVVAVSADSDAPPDYLIAGTPRGQFFRIAGEYDTFDATHGNMDLGRQAAKRAKLQAMGYDEVW